jgi:AcrR family transcriptional regulator
MNEADTATALLDVATELFAEHGYAGTSIRMITGAAGANLAAVTYHFGTKRALYGAVLERVFGPLAADAEAALTSEGAPLDRVEAFLRTLFGFLQESSHLPHLLLHEVAAGRFPPEEGFGVIRNAMMGLASVIAEGQAEGSVLEGDPFLLAASVVAQPVYFTLIRRVASQMGEDAMDAFPPARLVADRGRVEDHVVAVARRALAKGDT